MSGSILDALGTLGTDPSLMALTGAAGGFARAAMPQPYRGGTPFGAALGMAAAGAGSGAMDAYKAQLAQQQAQSAQMQNLAAASMLPVTLARNRMLAGIYNNPSQLNALMNGQIPSLGATAPTAAGMPSSMAGANGPNITNSIQTALNSIPDPSTRQVAISAAMRSGLPPAAWPAWIASIHNESGWNLQAPDGSSGEIGPGQIMPETGHEMGYTDQDLRNPATNLLASARYFGEKWQQGNADPAKAFAGYNTGDVAKNDPSYVSNGLGRLAQYGYPLASTTTSTTANLSGTQALALSDQYMQQANRIEMLQKLGIPVAGDPAALRTAAQQYRETALAGPTALAKSQNTPISLRQGGMALLPDQAEPGGYRVLKNPQVEETQTPEGATVPVHVVPASPFAPPGTPGTAEPILGPNGQPIVTKIPEQQQEGRNEAVRDFLTKDQDSYQAAQNTQAWVNQIVHAANTMNKAGPAYMTGPFAPQRLAAMSTVNDMARMLNIAPPFDQNAVASWEEMKKATTTAGFELSSHYEGHARQAAQTIMNATAAVPAPTNSPLGLQLVSAGIRAAAQSAIDAHEYKQQIYNQSQGAGLENAETDFYRMHPAQQYADRAISTVQPFVISGPKDFTKYLPGTFVTDGKTIDPKTGHPIIIQVPARPDAPPIPTYLQPGGAGG